MKIFKRTLSAVFSVLLVLITTLLPSLSACANAEGDEDPTGFGVKDMNYATALVAVPLENAVFDVCNVLAGIVDIWTPLSGKVYKNQTYGERGCQKYDLYIPKNLNSEEEQKLIIFIHGGTWTMGDKRHMAAFCSKYAKLGYITATINYDLASQGNDNIAKATGSKCNADIFDMLDDVTASISAIKEKCLSLGYSVNSLALSGVSAGSHISALYAYTRAGESAVPVKMIFNLTTPVGFFKGTFDNYTDAQVAQYASIVAGAELEESDISSPSEETKEILKSISPSANINENTVPTLMGYAGKDTTIGTNQYATIKPILDEKGVPNDVVWWKNCGHTLICDFSALKNWYKTSEEWLKKYM